MNLILFANGFPYGNWEPFLETESKYYDSFESVHICAMQIRKDHRNTIRPLPSDKFHVCPVPFAPMPLYLLNAFCALFDKNFYAELGRLLKEHRFSLMRLAWLLFYISRSHYEARKIKKYLKKAGLASPDSENIFYSYRFDYQPYVASLLKKSIPCRKLVARAHRYDLYEQFRKTDYIAMRPFLLDTLDEVILICDDGLHYLADKYPAYKDTLTISRLGTIDHGIRTTEINGGPIRLVSCSTLSPVKRVHLIVEALAQITDQEVCWTHYGEGVLAQDIKSLCAKLPENIHWELRGFVDNPSLMKEYTNIPYHLFLNVSESEGVPVSIMEAMSFGIPCIATDVGGTSEILCHGENGILLPADFTSEELADHIRTVAAMTDEEYQKYRTNARTFWQEHYSADKNYTAFVNRLKNTGG